MQKCKLERQVKFVFHVDRNIAKKKTHLCQYALITKHHDTSKGDKLNFSLHNRARER